MTSSSIRSFFQVAIFAGASCLLPVFAEPILEVTPASYDYARPNLVETPAVESVEEENFSPEEVTRARRISFVNPKTKHNRISEQGYMWPVRGAVLSPYGPRHGRIHPGIDIDGNTGDIVAAARSGIVVTAGRKYTGYGNMVDILHDDGVITRYGHATKVMVHVGQQVAQGEPIMTVGCTGRCTGPHVHFEVRKGGHPLNPMPYLR